ncbi:hypothetical protein BDY19DRAFT_1055402 [Irpex rosettiformis]|uniref:Uncharacterized protein n=1 Tax=Irpex rosettiformis TaxID=378272 RepID=A0ACB8UAB5_9APHY|nr:hypothetical protein BDY19DRAFT_1055402 [Irpex rosettiformis]
MATLPLVFAKLFPFLFFTLPGTVDPVFAFSVAGLVVAFATVFASLSLLVFLFSALSFYFPSLFFFSGVLAYVPCILGTDGSVPAKHMFIFLCATTAIFVQPYAFSHLSETTAANVLGAMIEALHLQYTESCQRVELLEGILKKALVDRDEIEMLIYECGRKRSRNEKALKRTKQTLAGLYNDVEQLERAIKKKRREVQRLKEQLTIYGKKAQEMQEAADKKSLNEIEAARKSHFKALAVAQQREEHQVFVGAKKNQRLKARLASVNKDIETVITAYRTDVARFEQEQRTHTSRYSALQGSLEFAAVEHCLHIEQCKRDRYRVQEQLEEKFATLEVTRRTHAIQLAATQRTHRLQASSIKDRNTLLSDRLASAIAARDSIMTLYQTHLERTQKELATHEAQYIALESSLAFANAEHRIHVEHCERERAQDEARIEELLAQLSTERAARAELQIEHDGLKARHAIVSEGYAEAEARLKTTEREVYLERQRHHAALSSYRASQQVSDTLIDKLVVVPRKRSPQQDLLRRALIGQTGMQNKVIESREPSSYQVQLTRIPPPSTVFDESWLLPQPDFVEGSSKDGSLTLAPLAPTPLRPRDKCLPLSLSKSTCNNVRPTGITEGHQPSAGVLALPVPLCNSTQPTSSSPSFSGSSSTYSDTSMASIIEKTSHPTGTCSSEPVTTTLDFDSEPSLPPLPERSTSLFDSDPELSLLLASLSDCSESNTSLELSLSNAPLGSTPSPGVSLLRNSLEVNCNVLSHLNTSPSTLDPGRNPFLLPIPVVVTPSVSSEPSMSTAFQAPQTRPSSDFLEADVNFDLGNKSFGADVVAKSTPIFTRWVNMQQRSSTPESPTRMSQSRSEVVLRASDLLIHGWGFEGGSEDIVDVKKIRKAGE